MDSENKIKTSQKRVVIKKHKKKKQKKMQRNVLILCIILIVGILAVSNINTILVWTGLGNVDNFQGDLSGNKKLQKLSIKETLYNNLSTDINFTDQNVINILFFGIDQNSDRLDELCRPDTIMLVSINLKTKAIQMVSIPRDSYVPIYGRYGKDKINACFYYGSLEEDNPENYFQAGVDCLGGTVSELLGGIPINYYMGVDMDGVARIIDTIGGVKVDVQVDVYWPDNTIYITKGEQVLDGAHFLYYARSRDYVMGDFTRMETQQMLLKALFKQMTSSDSIMKLPKLISQTFEIIKTDMSFKQMSSLAFTLKDFNADNIKSGTVPSYSKPINDLSYVVINQSGRVDFVEEYFGIKIAPGYQD